MLKHSILWAVLVSSSIPACSARALRHHSPDEWRGLYFSQEQAVISAVESGTCNDVVDDLPKVAVPAMDTMDTLFFKYGKAGGQELTDLVHLVINQTLGDGAHSDPMSSGMIARLRALGGLPADWVLPGLRDAYLENEARRVRAFGNRVSMIFAGDTTFAGLPMSHSLRMNGGAFISLFRLVARWTRDADIAALNLETTVALGGVPATDGRDYGDTAPAHFRAYPSVLNGLMFAGFNMAFLSNNHMMDYGEEGMTETVKWLRSVGIEGVGVPDHTAKFLPQDSLMPQQSGVIRVSKGVRIGFLGFSVDFYRFEVDQPQAEDSHLYPFIIISESRTLTDEVWGARGGAARAKLLRTRALASVRQLRKLVDVLVVYVHHRDEYFYTPTRVQQRVASLLALSGVDIVVSSGPHVMQESYVVNGTHVISSLGNFIMASTCPAPGGYDSVLAKLTVIKERLLPTGNKQPIDAFELAYMPIAINPRLGCAPVPLCPGFKREFPRLATALAGNLARTVPHYGDSYCMASRFAEDRSNMTQTAATVWWRGLGTVARTWAELPAWAQPLMTDPQLMLKPEDRQSSSSAPTMDTTKPGFAPGSSVDDPNGTSNRVNIGVGDAGPIAQMLDMH